MVKKRELFFSQKFKDVYKKNIKNRVAHLDVPLKRYLTKLEWWLERILRKNTTDGLIIDKIDNGRKSTNRFQGKFNDIFGNNNDNGGESNQIKV